VPNVPGTCFGGDDGVEYELTNPERCYRHHRSEHAEQHHRRRKAAVRAPDQAKELGNVSNRCQAIFPAGGLFSSTAAPERGCHHLGMTQLSVLRTLLPYFLGKRASVTGSSTLTSKPFFTQLS